MSTDHVRDAGHLKPKHRRFDGVLFYDRPRPSTARPAVIRLTTRDVLPERFDWRERTLGDGRAALVPARDQGDCGSCYAHALASMLTDRINIASDRDATGGWLSPADPVASGPTFVQQSYMDGDVTATARRRLMEQNSKLVVAGQYDMYGCDGAYMCVAVNYAVMRGLPSLVDVPYYYGGDSTQSAGNDATQQSGYYDRTDMTRWYASSAQYLCRASEDGFPSWPVTLSSDDLSFNNANMMTSIMMHGPIMVGFLVYTDFMYYPSLGNVYTRQDHFVAENMLHTNTLQGGHAVCLVGWDRIVDSHTGQLTDVWIARNSWSTDWGFDGYFYIRRGENHCNIELDAVTALPDIQQSPRDGPIMPAQFLVDGPVVASSSSDHVTNLLTSLLPSPTEENQAWARIVIITLLSVTIAVLIIAAVIAFVGLKRNRRQ